MKNQKNETRRPIRDEALAPAKNWRNRYQKPTPLARKGRLPAEEKRSRLTKETRSRKWLTRFTKQLKEQKPEEKIQKRKKNHQPRTSKTLGIPKTVGK